MATDEEVIASRKRVDDLRNQILEAKLSSTGDRREKENDLTVDSLAAEEARLVAELNALRGVDTEPTTVDGYIVPMGTVAIETDTIDVTPEQAAAVTVVPAPGEPVEPVVVSVSEAPAPKPAPVTASKKEV
jgi:hypothetical protein